MRKVTFKDLAFTTKSADQEVVILDPGEYVCRDVECPKCKGKPPKDRLIQTIEKGWTWAKANPCAKCKGTGVVPERVG